MIAVETYILTVIVASLLFDLFALLRWGKQATISAITLNAAKRWPLIPFLLGVLIGHLLWQNCP